MGHRHFAQLKQIALKPVLNCAIRETPSAGRARRDHRRGGGQFELGVGGIEEDSQVNLWGDPLDRFHERRGSTIIS